MGSGGLTAEETAELVNRARGGDPTAWEALVDAYSGVIWGVARGFRLRDADAGDVVQTTWLRLLEHVQRLNDPTRVGAWLATTARRECLRVVALTKRTALAGDDERLLDGLDASLADIDARLLAEERRVEVREAMAQLPPRWRQLLVALMADPTPSYEDVSADLAIPIGSIGPTRGRALRRLNELLDADESTGVLCRTA